MTTIVEKHSEVYDITIEEYNKNRDKNLTKLRHYKQDIEAIFDLIPIKYHKIRFTISFGEKTDYPTDKIVFSKSRKIGQSNVICLALNRIRHFTNINQCLYYNIKLKDKIPKVMWRGASSGSSDKTQNTRILCVTQWCDKCEEIDVGLTDLIRTHTNDKSLVQYKKGKIPNIEQLKNKYILSLEGYDVASSTAWNLACGSVMLAPKFTVETILGHSKLQEYVHYVPLKSDLSDLLDQYKWCEAHPDECQTIVDNARSYMTQFMIRNIIAESAKDMISYFDSVLENKEETKQ